MSAVTTRLELLGPTSPLSICVFCGARPGAGPGPAEIAAELGALIGQRGHNLVYGAGGVGLMREVARTAQANGAHVTGVVPAFLYELERVRQAVAHDLVVTDDMFERKRRMIAKADAFIALPGGYGTLDEVLEVVSLAYLGQCRKPLALVDVDGAWDSLLELFGEVSRRGFTAPDVDGLYRVASCAADAIDFVERRCLPVDRPALPARTAGAGR